MTSAPRLDGDALVLTRTFAASIDDVWAALTESERAGRWYGTWTGDPADGFVMVTMTGEGYEIEPSRFDIVACEPPRLLALHSVDEAGGWHLRADLVEADGVTTLEFRQERIDPGMLGDLGPGWEWYLDRLAAVVAGADVPTLDDFETRYVPLGPSFAALVADPS